jgi:tetratricopeptide (TPR) repeat protein
VARETKVLDIQAEQHEFGQVCQDLYEAVVDLKRRHDLHPCAVRPRDGLALRRDCERELVLDLVKRFRNLPTDQQRRLPALLNSLAQLEIVVGDLEAGQNDFQEVARLVLDPISQAEAYHNVYRAALERRNWTEALPALRRAVDLDAEAFEPFPFARYQPQRILGAGGFGATFVCDDQDQGIKVVVKALRLDTLDHDVETIFREKATLQDLDYPALIRAYAFTYADAEQKRRPYVVMEYFEGQTLAECVAKQGPMPPEDWFEIAWCLARALQAVHNRGVLHRSLRPGSVLLRREKNGDGPFSWRAKLLDTGLSLKRAVIHASASNPAAGVQTALGRSVVRTVAYSAPEVVGRPKGQVWVGPHSDVYSFGRLCAFALMGRPDADSADRIILHEAWGKLIDDCTHWTIPGRLANFGLVLERLAQVPGSNDRITRLESELYDIAIAEHTGTLKVDPTNVQALINRGNAHARKGDYRRAIADFTAVIKLQPRDAAHYRRRGLAHTRNRDLDAAIADYTEGLKLEPHNLEAFANRALAHAQRNDHDKAVADYTEAIHLNPRDPNLYYNRGNAHYCKRDFDLAIADYSETIRLDPKNAWALGNRGKAYALRGDQGKAIADFTRVLLLEPNNLRARWDRAQAYFDRKDYDQAVADYTEALKLDNNTALYSDRGLAHAHKGDFEAAIADFTQALNLDPKNADTFVFRGNAYSDHGDLEKALADLNEAITLNGDLVAAWYQRGNVHARMRALDQALADYTHALELNPKHVGAYFNRGNAHADKGSFDLAIADYTNVLQHEPRDPGAYTNRGNAYFSLGDYERAVADYNDALSLNSHDALALCNRANTYYRLRDYEMALADYTETLRLEPDNARAYNSRGNIYAERGQHDRALADYTAAIRIDDKFARAFCNRANLYADLGEIDKALADYTEAIAREPGHVPAWCNRGNIHAERGDDDAAIADLTEAISRDPTHAAALNNRGNAYRRRGDNDKAFEDFTAAIQADPSFGLAYANRGDLSFDLDHLDAALADYNEALRLEPGDVRTYHQRGALHLKRGDHQRALTDNLEAYRIAPDDPRASNNLAWLWATGPPPLRDVAKALEYARKACDLSAWKEPSHLDTLAVACAAAGHFAEALQWQQRAVELADESQKQAYRSRLLMYEAGKPFDGAVEMNATRQDTALPESPPASEPQTLDP